MKKTKLFILLTLLILSLLLCVGCKIAPVIETFEITSVTLSREFAEIYTDETLQLTSIVKAKSQYTDEKITTDYAVIYSSSDEGIAKIDENGLVTPMGLGTTTISATSSVGESTKTDTCSITVKSRPVESISTDKDFDLEVGYTKQLTVNFVPSTATNKGLTFVSSSPYILSVDDKGVVTAIRAGSGTITIKSVDGEKIATVKINCIVVNATGIKLDKTSFGLTRGLTSTIIASVLPERATEKTVVWTTSNPDVATVSSSGEVTAVNVGRAIITAKSYDGNFTATCSVEVVKPKATSFSISVTTNTLIIGQAQNITLNQVPADCIDTYVYTSSDPTIATVSQDGQIFAKKEGSIIITVSTADNRLTQTMNINVTPIGPAGIVITDLNGKTLNSASFGTPNGYDVKVSPVWLALSYYLTPNNATAKNVVVSSSNPNIFTATVSDNLIIIKAMGVRGTARLTVTSQVTSITKYIDITVGYQMNSTETISTAINNSDSNGIVFLYPKNYTESLSIYKNISLVGSIDSYGNNATTINGKITLRNNVTLTNINFVDYSTDILSMVDEGNVSNMTTLSNYSLTVNGCKFVMNTANNILNVNGNKENDSVFATTVKITFSYCKFDLNANNSNAVVINGLGTNSVIDINNCDFNSNTESDTYYLSNAISLTNSTQLKFNLISTKINNVKNALVIGEKTTLVESNISDCVFNANTPITLLGGTNTNSSTNSQNTLTITNTTLNGQNRYSVGNSGNVAVNDSAVIMLLGNDTVTLNNCTLNAKTGSLTDSLYPAYEYIFNIKGINNTLYLNNTTLNAIEIGSGHYQRADLNVVQNGITATDVNYLIVIQSNTGVTSAMASPIIVTKNTTKDLSETAKRVFGRTAEITYSELSDNNNCINEISNAGLMTLHSINTGTAKVTVTCKTNSFVLDIIINP